MGARPLARLIDTKIKSPLSRRVLFGDLVDGGKVNVAITDNNLTFSVSELVKPLTKEQRKAKKAEAALAETPSEVTDNAETQDSQA
jgi:ATP-dependent Clp protease ATP-binding subunit ClpA